MSLAEEITQEQFNPHEFIDRIAWKAIGKVDKTSIDKFDPTVLSDAFQRTFEELERLARDKEEEAARLEAQCQTEQREHWTRVGNLQRRNQATHSRFHELDERIGSIATKVVHVGDQLEGINRPRARDAQALELMNHFQLFLTADHSRDSVFTDESRIAEAADLMHKLQQIASELPSNGRYDRAQKQIDEQYRRTENRLIDEFLRAHGTGNEARMRNLISLLENYRDGYTHCIDRFIEITQKNAPTTADPLADILPLCLSADRLVRAVFGRAAEQVMAKFVLNIFHGRIQSVILAKLPEDDQQPEKFLHNLHELYAKVRKLSTDIGGAGIAIASDDPTYLPRLTASVFSRHLAEYVSIEMRYLRQKYIETLRNYYAAKGHQRKQIQGGNLGKVQQLLTVTTEHFGAETFVSHELAINVLQEAKLAFKRCQTVCQVDSQGMSNFTQLSASSSLAENAFKIFDLLVHYLVVDHVTYAVDLSLLNAPPSDPKTEPDCHFLRVVHDLNPIMSLFEGTYREYVVPLVGGSLQYAPVSQLKRGVCSSLEAKIDQGLDKSIASMAAYARHLLQTEQRRSDFRPETEAGSLPAFSNACKLVVAYTTRCVEQIKASLDGRNQATLLNEFGLRLHRVVFDNFTAHQYNDLGAMLAICDANEYRRCAKQFGSPTVDRLYDTLHELCNLLIVLPDNLLATSRERLAHLDRSVVLSFVQLRGDYKSARLADVFNAKKA